MKPKKSPPITHDLSGLPEGPASTSSPSVPDQGTDVPPAYEVDEENTRLINERLTDEQKSELHRLYPEADVVALGKMAATADQLEASPEFTAKFKEKVSLAQSVLYQLSTKLPSSAPVVPRGVPILGKPKGPSSGLKKNS
jgi:hypothetical protein